MKTTAGIKNRDKSYEKILLRQEAIRDIETTPAKNWQNVDGGINLEVSRLFRFTETNQTKVI